MADKLRYGVIGIGNMGTAHIKLYSEGKIKEMVLQLPESFHKGKDGGHSFLNMCENKDGDLWTGFQTEQEKLALLGMATHVLMPLLPIEESHVLPGGMPYFRVEVDE